MLGNFASSAGHMMIIQDIVNVNLKPNNKPWLRLHFTRHSPPARFSAFLHHTIVFARNYRTIKGRQGS